MRMSGCKALMVVACDMDGTIVDAHNRVSSRLWELVDALAKRKVRFLLCTGRNYADMRSALPADRMEEAILLNGALYCDRLGKTIVQRPMAVDDVRQCVERIRRYSMPILFYCAEDTYVSGDPGMIDACARKYYGLEKMFPFPLKRIDLAEIRNRNVLKIETMCTDPEMRKSCYEALQQYELCQVTHSADHNIEVTGRGVDKGSMLEIVLQRYGKTTAETIVFGDSANDLSMFQQVSCSCAMANAPEEVKRQASFVTESVEAGGVEAVLERLLLAHMDKDK